MSVSDVLEIDLPEGDGSTASEDDDALIYCDFSLLPEEIGRRATQALESVAAALRGGDSDFLWSEPDPVGVGIALQVLTCLPDRTAMGKGPVYRIAFEVIATAARSEGDVASARGQERSPDPPTDPKRDGRERPKRFLTTGEAADYCRVSASTLNRKRVTGEGPRYTKRGRRVIYDTTDLDVWMEEGKRRFTNDDEDE